MKSAVLLFVYFLVLIAKALRPGGIKTLIAEGGSSDDKPTPPSLDLNKEPPSGVY
jgi:hypothetical protein